MVGRLGGWNPTGKGVKGKQEGSSTQRGDTLQILMTKVYFSSMSLLPQLMIDVDYSIAEHPMLALRLN
jgi:hypothetical protein